MTYLPAANSVSKSGGFQIMYYSPQQKANSQYQQTQIMSADPLQLLIMTYDYTIAGCRERNLEKVSRGLQELMDNLNHDEGGQFAADLLSLYFYMADLARHNKYDEAAGLLRDLRNTWAQAREQMFRQQPAPAMRIAA
jgi:flagellin-specific chaperone FliS